MTLRHQIEVDLVFLLAASVFVGFVFALFYHPAPKIRFFSMPSIELVPSPTVSPSPVFSPKIETFSQISPDGTKKLTLTTSTNKDETKTYAFTTSESDNTNQQSIYSVTLPENVSMNVPFNTWSPDNAYVFLEKSSSNEKSALVMRANGQPFAESQQYHDVAALFVEKNTGSVYKETTGWASENLLIVNTTKPDGSKGSSYWFEVPSKAILQLSTDFY